MSIQFSKFVIVGGLNTAFSYAIYALLVYLGVLYVFANLAAMLLGIVFSFITQSRFVFSNNEGRRIFRFATAWCAIWLINIALIALGIRLGLNAYSAGLVALFPITITSYMVQRFIVFGKPSVNLNSKSTG